MVVIAFAGVFVVVLDVFACVGVAICSCFAVVVFVVVVISLVLLVLLRILLLPLLHFSVFFLVHLFSDIDED